MSISMTFGKLLSGWRVLLLLLVIYLLSSAVVRQRVPAPVAVALESPLRSATDVVVFSDDSWIDANGERHLSQSLFDALFQSIRDAEKLVLVDMFLFNEWQGPVPESHRATASELSKVLIEQKKQHPLMNIVVISDPINTVYGGLRSSHFDEMEAAGIEVVLTRLEKLQDSNPLWSGIWRWLIRPFGNSEGTILPNPFGEGRVSIRSYLALLNFKANHRKLLIADHKGGALKGWVSSANPHDGSSAHRNIALNFGGQAVIDLLASEQALLLMSGADRLASSLTHFIEGSPPGNKAILSLQQNTLNEQDSINGTDEHIQIVSESRIHDSVLAAIDGAGSGDVIEMVMFYLSERQIIESLKLAKSRGALIRIILDVNNDAFGRQKNGVPNRPVAAELVDAGIEVRWCHTLGEQCHAKWLHVGRDGRSEFYVGSANFTGRNLLDLNMETNARVLTMSDSPLALDMLEFFERQWSNENDRGYTLPYETFANDSMWLKWQYRFMEMTGLSTF